MRLKRDLIRGGRRGRKKEEREKKMEETLLSCLPPGNPSKRKSEEGKTSCIRRRMWRKKKVTRHLVMTSLYFVERKRDATCTARDKRWSEGKGNRLSVSFSNVFFPFHSETPVVYQCQWKYQAVEMAVNSIPFALFFLRDTDVSVEEHVSIFFQGSQDHRFDWRKKVLKLFLFYPLLQL